MPKLTVRAFAEMMVLPAYEQERILFEQKYPKKAPQIYKAPYYAPALSAIRRYYRGGNDTSILDECRLHIQESAKPPSKCLHNLRVIDAFNAGPQAMRQMTLRTFREYTLGIGSVVLRLNFDLIADEAAKRRRLFYNVRNAELDCEVARLTLELAQIVLRENGQAVPATSLEFVDLFSQTIVTSRRLRTTTEEKVKRNASIIERLWPAV
jgi:hypothetical protein